MRLVATVPIALLTVIGAGAVIDAFTLVRRDEDRCYAMVFGEWSPPLRPGTGLGPVQPGRSAWAAWAVSRGDSALVLFPEWWPAGIAVRLDAGADRESRTGRATAFASDGRTARPEATVRARRVPCGAPPPAR